MRVQVVFAFCFLVLINAMPFEKLDHEGDSVKFEARFSDKKFDYEMKRPLQDVCADRQVRVLILVTSGMQNFDKRQAIRESWMHDESNPADYLTLFLLGQSDNKTLNDEIHQEELKYGDIIRYSGVDLYDMLPLKTHAALSWYREFCPNAEYVMKTDDDTVVYMKRFDTFVRDEFGKELQHNPATIFCNLLQGYHPIRNRSNKYYISRNEFRSPIYPDFCQGCSYLVSRQAARQILDHTQEVPFLRLEDVLMTGIVGAKSDVNRIQTNAMGNKVSKALIDKRGEPFLSVVVGLPASKLSDAYFLLKNPETSNLLSYDYHHAKVSF